MKKTFKSILLAILSVFAFTCCEDVPEPYQLPSKTEETPDEVILPSGDGTLAAPYNIAKLKELIDANQAPTGEIYIKGKISSIKSLKTAQYTRAQYYISDNGKTTDQFYVYNGLYLNGENFTSDDQIKVGDEVVILGKLTTYNGSYQVDQNSKIISLNAQGSEINPDEPVEPSGTGTKDDPYNIAKIKQLISENKAPEGEIYIKGIISQIKSLDVSKYTRAQYYISDNGQTDNQFYVYNGLYMNGANFTSNDQIKVGDKVVILGTLGTYKDEYQVAQNSKIVSLNDNSDNGGGQGGGESGNIQHISIAEFLAKADANTTYELTGIVKNIANTTYGNFDLVEGDASIFIYGLLDLEGNKKNFASLGIVEGDEVTLTGKYKLYNEKAEIADAQFVSVKKGDGGQGGDQGGGDQGGGDQGGGDQGGGDPVTDLVNGDFESWVSDTEATGWKSASSASNAILSKSTESRNGSFACKVGAPGTQNKRLATQEMTLAAGSYTFSYYAKSTTADKSQTKGGYVHVNDDGTITDSYQYSKTYTDLNSNEWTLVTCDFELSAPTKICLIVMNPKGSSYSVSQDILVDDATLVKK